MSENFLNCFNFKSEDKINGLHGEYWIRLYDSTTKELVEEHHGHNIIVSSASTLIAWLLKDTVYSSSPVTNSVGGIAYLAVGSGNPAWNLQNPPAPQITQTALVSETARVPFGSENTTFIDPVSGDTVSYPTNIVDYTATFSETQAVGPIVEMGLIGGDAQDTPDPSSDILVSYRTFPVINKSNSLIMSFTYRITS
jgi:hypothetical protein